MNMTNEKLSPFSVFEGEELVRFVPECPRSIFLSDLDKMILVILNTYHLLTSALLTTALENLGLKNFNQSDIQNRLRLLSESAFIEKGEFRSLTGKSANKLYSLGFRGRGWLKANGKRVVLAGYLEKLDACDAKRILSVNQFLIRSKKSFEDSLICQPIFVTNNLGERKDDMIFRAFGLVRQDDCDYIVESVRRSDTWKNDLTNKMARIEKVVKSKRLNLEKPLKNPVITLICEDERHLLECMDTLKDSKLTLRYSHDLAIYKDADNCLSLPPKKESKTESLFRLLFGVSKTA